MVAVDETSKRLTFRRASQRSNSRLSVTKPVSRVQNRVELNVRRTDAMEEASSRWTGQVGFHDDFQKLRIPEQSDESSAAALVRYLLGFEL